MKQTIIKKSNNSPKYVVTRNGFRVSDVEYFSTSDAQDECDFWRRVVKNYPDGSKVEIVEMDNKKHRVYHMK